MENGGRYVCFSEKYWRFYEVENILDVRLKRASEVMNECKTASATNDPFFSVAQRPPRS